jgi:PIN domain nuclease of toxin-antitoxin system
MIYLDTHVVVWAYAGEIDRFPASVRTRIEESDLLISPIVLLELQYLKEIDRLTVEPGVIYENLASTIGLAVCDLPLMRVVTEAMLQSWTRDPFDRIITATAAARDALLLTKDESIHSHYAKALWDKAHP